MTYSHTGQVVTWFGDPDTPSDRSYFIVLQDRRGGSHPDWETQDYGSTHHIPGSDDNDIYDGGAGPDEITLRLKFDDRAQYRDFRSRIKSTNTLQLLAGLTTIAGTVHYDMGCAYERYAPVYLRRPHAISIRMSGVVTCEATFVLLGGGA